MSQDLPEAEARAETETESAADQRYGDGQTCVQPGPAPGELFAHTLHAASLYSVLRELRNQLEQADRPEAAHANALLAILAPC